MTTKRIAHVTDAHLGQRLVTDAEIAGDKMRYDSEPEEHQTRLWRVLDSISSKGITDLVFGGDIGTPDSVGAFFKMLDGYKFTPSIVLGNHDAYRDVAPYGGAGAVDGKMCWSRDDGPLKRICLDSSDGTIGERQLAWLAHELAGARKVVLFLHHPILEIDTPVARSGAALLDRGAIKALLANSDCEVTVVCGHYHMIDEARDANIRQVVTPAVSYQIVKHAGRLRVDHQTFGYRILDVDGAEIGTEIVLLTEADRAHQR